MICRSRSARPTCAFAASPSFRCLPSGPPIGDDPKAVATTSVRPTSTIPVAPSVPLLGSLPWMALDGAGFTTHVAQGDDVTAGQLITTYDVAAVEAKGLNPVVPVVIMDEREPGNITASEAVASGAEIDSGTVIFTAVK